MIKNKTKSLRLKKYFPAIFLMGMISGMLNAESTDELTTGKIEASDSKISGGESWKSEEVRNSMGSRTVISNKQLTETANQSVDEALQNIPGVQIRDYSGTGILPKISFRGFGGAGNGHSNTGLILLDGIPIYGGPYSNLELAVFPITFQAVDHIDVIKGGASVQYGPNTFGGVINVISKDIPQEWENQISQRITFWGKDDGTPFRKNGEPVANNMLFDTYLKTGGMINKYVGVQAEANYVGGQSFRENSPTQVRNYMLRGVYNINDSNNVKMYYQYYSYYAKDPGSLSTQDYKHDRFQNKRPNNSNDGVAKRFGVTYNNYFGDLDKIGGNFTFEYYMHDMTRNFTIDNNYNTINYSTAPTSVSDNVRRFVVNGVEPKLSLNVNTGILKQTILLGGRFLTEDIYAHAYKTTYATGDITDPSPSVNHNNYTALYISDSLNFWDSLTIAPGLRYEYLNYTRTNYYGAKAGTYHSYDGKDNNQFNPAINIGYKPIKDLLLYANYQRSFIPPGYGDIQGVTDTDYFQNFQTTEVGARYTLNDTLSINANYFAIFGDNYRVLKFDSAATNAMSQGVELEAYYSPIGNLTIHAAYTYTDARITDSKTNSKGENIKGKMLPFVSPHQFVLDALYTLGKTSFGISSYYYSKSYSDINNSVQETADEKGGELPWYWVWNAQVSRTLWKQGRQSIEGSLAMNNIFNMKYYFRGIGTSPSGRQPAPGRSVSVYVSYKF